MKAINITIPEIAVNGIITGNGVEDIVSSAMKYVECLNTLSNKLDTFVREMQELGTHQEVLISRYVEIEEEIENKEIELNKLNETATSLKNLSISIPGEMEERITALSKSIASLKEEMDSNIEESTAIEEFFDSFYPSNETILSKESEHVSKKESKKILLEAYHNDKFDCISFKVIEGDARVRYVPDKNFKGSKFFGTIKEGERFILGNSHEFKEDLGWKVYIDSLIALDKAEEVVDKSIITDTNDLFALAEKFNKKVC